MKKKLCIFFILILIIGIIITILYLKNGNKDYLAHSETNTDTSKIENIAMEVKNNIKDKNIVIEIKDKNNNEIDESITEEELEYLVNNDISSGTGYEEDIKKILTNKILSNEAKKTGVTITEEKKKKDRESALNNYKLKELTDENERKKAEEVISKYYEDISYSYAFRREISTKIIDDKLETQDDNLKKLMKEIKKMTNNSDKIQSKEQLNDYYGQSIPKLNEAVDLYCSNILNSYNIELTEVN